MQSSATVTYLNDNFIAADSPKLTSKQTNQLQRGKSLGTALPHIPSYGGSGSSNVSRRSSVGFPSSSTRQQQPQRPHSIVVVKAASDLMTNEQDADLVRLAVSPSHYLSLFFFLCEF